MPATETERHEILPRLQQILMARVAIAELPIQFTSVAISMSLDRVRCRPYSHSYGIILENGIVTLAVDGEFEVKLGVTSDNLFAPWHVYKTKLFLRDPEEPGKSGGDEIKLHSRFIFTGLFFRSEQELVHAVQVGCHRFCLRHVRHTLV